MYLLDLFQGLGGVGRRSCIHFFRGLFSGGSDAEKWGGHQKNKFFIDVSVETLIPFKQGHQDLLKLHVPLGEGDGFCPGKNGAPRKVEK